MGERRRRADPRRSHRAAHDDRRAGPAVFLALAWLALMLICAVAGPALPLQDPNTQGECTTRQPDRKLGPDGEPVVVDGRYVLVPREGCPLQKAADDAAAAQPSARHWLGNDQLGRDILARLVAGSRTTLIAVFGSILLAALVGVPVGMGMAFVGGRVDRAALALLSGFLAVPGIVLIIVVMTAMGRGVFQVAAALAVVSAPALALGTRAAALSVMQEDFVAAARIAGAQRGRIIFREVLPNVAPNALVYAGVAVSVAVGGESGLALLGLGVPEPATSWGSVVAGGIPLLQSKPHIVLLGSLVIFLTILSATVVGDWLDRRFAVGESRL